MEPLSSLDASFILAEKPGLPMHISSVSIYAPSSHSKEKATGSPVRFKQIMHRFEEAIYEVPMLRRRLVEVPGNLDFPYWIEDPDFDIEFHVRHIALPKPGDWRQFFIQLARLHSRPLDMSRPLWEIYVIEGLDRLEGIPTGSFAVVQKIHHAAMDGTSVKKMFMALHETQLSQRKQASQTLPLLREQRPGTLSMIARASRRAAGRPLRLGRTAVKVIESLHRVNRAEKLGDIDPEIEPPHCRFSGATSPYRGVTAATFDLDEFMELRRLLPGITLNDLALSICGGALLHYLRESDELPEQPLVAQVPVDIRAVTGELGGGNQISTLNASCGSDIEDPLERLDAVAKSTSAGKKRLQAMGESLIPEAIESMGPHITQALYNLIYSSSSFGVLGSIMPESPNLVFSNMPGPRDPVYFCGAELVWGTGLGPIMPTNGLFVAVSSIRDKLTYGITACREMMPDPERFQRCLVTSYEETRLALQQQNATGTSRRRTPKRRIG